MSKPIPTQFKPKPTVTEPPCVTCRWRYADGRCHFNPPEVRLPYDQLSAWPVVPPVGGGCSKWEQKEAE